MMFVAFVISGLVLRCLVVVLVLVGFRCCDCYVGCLISCFVCGLLIGLLCGGRAVCGSLLCGCFSGCVCFACSLRCLRLIVRFG